MHILLVNNLYPPLVAGGAELVVSYLAEGLAARDHRVTVVSTCGPKMEPYPAEARNGVEVIRFFPPNLYWSFDRDRNPGMTKWLWHARDAWNRAAAQRFAGVLKTARPDIVHTHVIDGFSASIWDRARRQGVPVVHTAHDYHLICPRAFMLTGDWKLCTRPSAKCRLYRGWHLATTRHIDLFTSPSRFLIDEHVRAGMTASATEVVSNGIPQPDGVRAVRRMRTADSRKRFLMLSRLTIDKGVEVVLEAMRQMPADVDIEVAIAGEEKNRALAGAGYLLLPSLWYENAPVAIVEAAAYGLGVIGSNLGAIPEFIEDGKTGVLFPPGDATALAQIMLLLSVGRNPLPDLDRRSESLARHFTVDRMVGAYETHYRRLIGAEPVLAMAG
jgi:glycosyltransferase involved in cell wall biosynthesis